MLAPVGIAYAVASGVGAIYGLYASIAAAGSAATKLTTWLASEGHAPTIAGVTKRIASDYRIAAFVRPGVNAKTANKDISALSSLWKFAARRALGDANPWQGQSLAALRGQ
jgi:hypothetical protein